ncbi:S-adenosyl-L-methionine-dependent methyltransferase [Stipitochalara longipes BDJ]|nr:S-adenosyl-L-methionine-dependent methyltransferase [Stipitochalara longipes BDJ]
MEHDPETAALIKKYPSLGKAIETGIESHDGREEALFQFILAHPDFENLKGNPPKLLQAIDEFSATHDFLISIGAHKAKILSDLIAKEKPSVVVELGGYLGYSAILFADNMRTVIPLVSSKLQVWSLEMNPEFAAIAEKLIEIAGLSDFVTVAVGPAEDTLKKLNEEGKLLDVDMLFLDHAEELYVSDFKVCEGLGLLKKGAVIVADNVVRPGAPEYRELVRGHIGLKSEGVRGLIQPGDLEDELEISHVMK